MQYGRNRRNGGDEREKMNEREMLEYREDERNEERKREGMRCSVGGIGEREEMKGGGG